jgi:ABC-type uncharacterized transport system substrate-binding protein
VIGARHFQPLRDQQYFLDLRVDGRALRVESVRDFRASVDEDRVTYTFRVPVIGANPREGALEIRVSDPTFYVDFEPEDGSPVRWSAPPTYAVRCQVTRSSGFFESPAIQCSYRRRSP